jgi:hypothetical protein
MPDLFLRPRPRRGWSLFDRLLLAGYILGYFSLMAITGRPVLITAIAGASLLLGHIFGSDHA